jgi:uncharacterized protein
MNQMVYYDHILEPLSDICRQWGIVEFSIYGFSITKEFQANSHVDCLVEFSPEVNWDLFEIVKLKRQLSELFQRKVDLVEKASIVNPFILESIEEERRVLYSSYGHKKTSLVS